MWQWPTGGWLLNHRIALSNKFCGTVTPSDLAVFKLKGWCFGWIAIVRSPSRKPHVIKQNHSTMIWRDRITAYGAATTTTHRGKSARSLGKGRVAATQCAGSLRDA